MMSARLSDFVCVAGVLLLLALVILAAEVGA